MKINWENSTSLHNWIEQLDLACKKDSTVAWIGSIIFLGWMLASVVIPPLSDRLGRKWIFITFLILNLGVIATLTFSRSIYLTICANFLVGVIAVARWTVGYIML